MNGKAAQLERWLMAIRQRALTNTLGQVTCAHRNRVEVTTNATAYRLGRLTNLLAWRCKDCGAAV